MQIREMFRALAKYHKFPSPLLCVHSSESKKSLFFVHSFCANKALVARVEWRFIMQIWQNVIKWAPVSKRWINRQKECVMDCCPWYLLTPARVSFKSNLILGPYHHWQHNIFFSLQLSDMSPIPFCLQPNRVMLHFKVNQINQCSLLIGATWACLSIKSPTS